MNEKNPRPLDEDDIALLKTYVRASTPRLDLSDFVDLGFFGDLDLGAGLRIVSVVVRARDRFRVPDLGHRV